MRRVANPVSILVQKYGGSSVADPERLRQVAARVAAAADAGAQVVVVVSAMGKTTDQLLALARSVVDAPPRRELDMLLTAGERISMALLAMAVQARGRAAVSFTGSQSGIITDERHTDARILEIRPTRIREALDAGQIVIVAGYQGVSKTREITTLGRGGSDTTAVALAAALGAEACEIYSDVDGVLTADPRVVPEARRLDAVGYDEMQELAEHGARVLCAQAVEWARRAGIVVHSRQTGGDGPGTRVVAGGGGAPRGRAVAVAGQKDLVRLRLAGGGVGRLAAALAERRCDPRAVHAVDGAAEAIVSRANCHDLDAICGSLAGELGGALAIERGLGAATVVGPGLGDDAQAIARALSACAAAEPLGFVAAPLRITVLCREGSVDDAVRALHAAFVG